MSVTSPMKLAVGLQRKLGLPLLVLYGTGITIGAGIYVLIGAVAGRAGPYAPWSFFFAAIVMSFTVASYAELSTRFPVSAGEAAYVKAAFDSRLLSRFIGILTVAIGIVSSAAVTLGSAGYIEQFIELPRGFIVIIIVVGLGIVAAIGILESVLVASIFTLIEIGGLIAIIVPAIYADLPISSALTKPPPFEIDAFSGITFGSLLAFFAFIGFEDLANVVEEAKAPHRNIPWAMALTLLISTLLYVAVATVAISAVSIDKLSSSSAPLSLVFQKVSGVSPATISAIAIFATLNTILAQITMASRVIYGMARQGDMPSIVGRVYPHTATPIVATALIVILVIALAFSVPFEQLAESTSLATLVVFAFVNLSLICIRYRRIRSYQQYVSIPVWVPVAGLVTCIMMIASALLR